MTVMNKKPAVCLALIAGMVYSAAESRVAEIRTPAVRAFHLDDTAPHWSYVMGPTNTYNRFTIGSNTMVAGPHDWT